MYEVTKVQDQTTPEGTCGAKQTGCPDQMAKTLKLFLDHEEH